MDTNLTLEERQKISTPGIYIGCWVTWGAGLFARRLIRFIDDGWAILGQDLFCVWKGEFLPFEPRRAEGDGWLVEDLRLVFHAGEGPGEEIVHVYPPAVAEMWDTEETDPWAPTLEEMALQEDDHVHQPAHYARFKIEPITFIMENDLPFHVGNIIKYICRAGHKRYDGLDSVDSEIRDLEKVRRYAEMRIDQLKGKEGML